MIEVNTSTPSAASARQEKKIHHEGQIDQVEQALDGGFRRHGAADSYGEDAVALDDPLELAVDDLAQKRQARDLHAAGCRARAAADEHERQQNELRQRMPDFKIFGNEAGRRRDRDDLKQGAAEGRLQSVAPAGVEIAADQPGRRRDQNEIEPHLEIAQHAARLSLDPQAVLLDETDAGQQHENDDDVFDQRAFEAGDARGAR